MNEVSKNLQNKKIQQYCLYAFVCLLAFCYFHWKECGIDNGTTNTHISSLEQVRVHGESIQAGLGDIEQSTDCVERTIEQSKRTITIAQQTVARIERNLNESAEIIAECRRILQKVGEKPSTINP